MALDTPNKRAAAVYLGSPWRPILPFPDGAMDAGDRLSLAYLYPGISASDVVVLPYHRPMIRRLKMRRLRVVLLFMGV